MTGFALVKWICGETYDGWKMDTDILLFRELQSLEYEDGAFVAHAEKKSGNMDMWHVKVSNKMTGAYRSWRDSCDASAGIDKGDARSVDLFDFSERKSLKRAAEVVTAVGGVRREAPLLVLPIGDALQEPFWPEGLGVNRGMHNALDACWAAQPPCGGSGWTLPT